MRPPILFLLLSLAVGGCYRRHEPTDPPTARDAGHDAGRDAGVVATIDAGGRDAGPGVDAGPPLPREPEPDPGSDGRPSDDPDAGEWEDPPVLGEEDDCCVLGEPVLLPSPWENRGDDVAAARYEPPPRVGWGAGEWGVAFSYQVLFREPPESRFQPKISFIRLAADGTPLSSFADVDSAPVGDMGYGAIQSVRWAAGRWAIPMVAAETDGGLRTAHVHFLDAESRPVALIAMEPAYDGTVDAAYVAHGDRWLGFGADGVSARAEILDELGGVDPPIELNLAATTWLRAAGVGSRIAVLHGSGNLLRAGGVEVTVVDHERAVLGRVPLGPSAIHQAATARLRDLVVAVIEDRERVHVQPVDPFAMAVVGPRTTLAEGHIRAVDAAGSDKHGVVGVCWAREIVGDRPEDHDVLFRLVGPDGRPVGRAVTIASGNFRGPDANCMVGSDGAGFLVLWWEGHDLWVRRVDVALR